MSNKKVNVFVILSVNHNFRWIKNVSIGKRVEIIEIVSIKN